MEERAHAELVEKVESTMAGMMSIAVARGCQNVGWTKVSIAGAAHSLASLPSTTVALPCPVLWPWVMTVVR